MKTSLKNKCMYMEIYRVFRYCAPESRTQRTPYNPAFPQKKSPKWSWFGYNRYTYFTFLKQETYMYPFGGKYLAPLKMWKVVSANPQNKDVCRKTMEMLQRAHIYMVNCCLKVLTSRLSIVLNCGLFFIKLELNHLSNCSTISTFFFCRILKNK